MKSIKLKLVILYLALVFIVMIVSGTFMLNMVRTREITKAHYDLQNYAKQINDQIVQVYPPDEFQTGFSSMYMFTSGIKGYILNNNGQVIAPASAVGQSFADSVIISAYYGEESFSGIKKGKDAGDTASTWLNYAMPASKGDARYVIFVRMDAKDINLTLSDITFTIILMVILALTLTGVLGVLFANTLTGPIIALTKKAKEMAEGNLNQEIPVAGSDEIGQLTQTFNHMASELSASMASMASEKNKMEVVLDNMTDGVLAYDHAGTLIHANSSCYDLLNFGEIECIPFVEMMEKLGFDADDLRSISPEPDVVKESTIYTDEKYVSVSVTPYLNTSGAVSGLILVLQDITRLKKLDNMRKEFVANVSHELRTPLTVIKTYTETLIDGALDDRGIAADFLKKIDSETERMTLMVRDLLELSRFDNEQLKLELEVIDLNGLISQCIRQNKLLAEQKNQRILYDTRGGQLFIEGDAGRINQVLTNILTNSIKYSHEDTDIEVFTDESEKYYRVYIRDHGIGIPKEDLRQIFERFYRVDKARSRAMGGTGLGLAIAKEIVEAHGGRISALSAPGDGTTMVLRFLKIDGHAMGYEEEDTDIKRR